MGSPGRRSLEPPFSICLLLEVLWQKMSGTFSFHMA